jgi:hypothetical protein
MRTLTSQELTAVSGAAITLPTIKTDNTGVTVTLDLASGTVSKTFTWKQIIGFAAKLIKSF